MRIYIDEMHRLWRTPGIIFAVIIACFATFGVLNIQSKKILNYVQASDYKEAFSQLENLSPEEAYAGYADKQYGVMDFSREALLNNAIKSELSETVSYEAYLDGITDTADRITSVSIFADKDSFSYRNAKKISEKYEKLKGRIETETGPSKGVELWSGNGIVGIIIILVLVLMINEMILKDRENGQLNLLFTMDKGREAHGAVKLLVCATSAFAVTFIILLTDFFTCAYLFGIGDITRPVQSVVGLKGCIYEISVLEYMLIYFLLLSITAAVVSTVVFFTASLINSSVMVYLAVAGIFGVEAVLYYLINENSYLAFFREFNLISFLNTGRYMSVYGNVSLAGYPVDRLLFVIISLAVIAAVLVPLSVRAYGAQNTIVVKRNRIRSLFGKRAVQGSVSVMRHEAYKLLICGGTLWVLIFFAVFSIMDYTPAREYFENEDDFYYKRYLRKYEGPVTDDKLKAVGAEQVGFREKGEELSLVLAECPPELAVDIAAQYQEELKPEAGLAMLVQRIDALKENGGYIVYDTGYRLLTFDSMAARKELTLAITAGIMVVLSLTFLFAGDDRLYMDRVTSVTFRGRKKLLAKKILLGCGILLVIYAVNYVPDVLSTLKVYGSSGLSFPAQSVVNLEGTVFEKLGFNIGGCVLFFQMLKYLIMVSEMLVLSIISKKLRSLSRTMVTGMVVFVGPLLILYVIK